jgi:flagellar hook-associated protein 2
MLKSLRSSVASKIPGLTGPSSLADIGVSTGGPNAGAINREAVDGKLTFDGAKLTAALTADPVGVRKLLGGMAGTAGFAQAFGTVLGTYAGPGGIFESRTAAAASALARLQRRLDTFDGRMDAKQAFYQKRFTALEQAMSRSQGTSGRLQAYLTPRPA